VGSSETNTSSPQDATKDRATSERPETVETKGLRVFEHDIVNILLGILLTLLIAFLLFGGTIGKCYNSVCAADQILAGSLIVFLIKYMHEASVVGMRMESLSKLLVKEGSATTEPFPGGFAVFLFRVLTPLITCYFVAFFLLNQKGYTNPWLVPEVQTNTFALKMAGLALFLHSMVFTASDLALARFMNWYTTRGTQKEQGKGKRRNKWRWLSLRYGDRSDYSFAVVLTRWLVLDVAVSLFVAGGGLAAVIGMTVNMVFLKIWVAGVLFSQSALDYWMNWRFFFHPGKLKISVE
jgi:hypothetical protein